MRYALTFSILILMCSCSLKREQAPQETAPESESLKTEYFRKGGEIVDASQAELMKNVAQAMGSGGPGHAVDFCNVHALSIKDSLSALYNCEIRRIAIKYRNPEDRPTSETEKELLSNYQDAALKRESLKAEVYLLDDRAEYYHPIFIKNQACLLCHGKPGEKISDQTMEMIANHYPAILFLR